MKLTSVSSTFLLLIEALAAQQALDHLPAADRIAVPAKGVAVPMGDIDGRPLVELTINGKGPYPFILDTGASDTVVDEGLAKDLTLAERTGSMFSNGPHGQMVRIEELRIGEASLSGVTAEAMPLSAMFAVGNPPRGVLSAASFPGYLLSLDYPGKRITIRKGELSAPDSRRIFGYTADQILPNVPVTVAGTVVRAHIDSGSPASLTLPTKYLKELAFKAPPIDTGKKMRTHAGTFPVWSGQVDGEIKLGEYKLDVADVRFSDVNPIPGEPTGNIGYQLLRDFVVTMDAKNRRIAVEK